jgi:hypothetical protein
VRTVRGKMALFAAPLTAAVGGVMLARLPETVRADVLPWWSGPLTGSSVAAASTWLGLLSLEALLVNQFAIDGAGLTRELLAPCSELDLVRGKAAGGAMLVALGAGSGLALVALLLPRGALASWLAIPLVAMSAYALAAPGFLVLSVLMPRRADLSHAGGEGRPNMAASLAGTLAMGLSLAIPALLFEAGRALVGPPWALLALLLWTLACASCCVALLPLVARLLARRRESLALVVAH